MHVRLRDGRVLTQAAHGARGYPDKPASQDELDAKFLACAVRALPGARAEDALALLRRVDELDSVRPLAALL